MELFKGNKLRFQNENEYYETLGFICNEKHYIRVYTESNERLGAWGSQGRLSISTNAIDAPEPLRKAFSESTDNRISETKYVRKLQDNHAFDVEDGDYSKTITFSSITNVLDTVPDEYKEDFNRGFKWNCELKDKIREIDNDEINYDEKTVVEELEGAVKRYYTTKYERKKSLRDQAVRIHGTKCMVCGFDFEMTYGSLGKCYIEVHHVKPLSSLDEETVVNPETDLICVCANCHRMLHRSKEIIITPEELKDLINASNDR